MSTNTGEGTMRFDPHQQSAERTMRFEPNHNQGAESEATEFGSSSAGAGIGTQKFEPGHNSAADISSAAPNAAAGSSSTGNRGIGANSGAASRHNTNRSIIRKIPKGPVLVTIIGMLLIAIVAFFTMFDDVWYNIR